MTSSSVASINNHINRVSPLLTHKIKLTHKKKKKKKKSDSYIKIVIILMAQLSSYRLMKPSAFLNSIFMSTVNTAAKTLVSVASTTSSSGGDAEASWKLTDHFRYMMMLTTWLTVWVLRVLMDHIPTTVVPSPRHLLSLGSSSEDHNSLVPSSSSSSPSSSSSYNFDLILHEGLNINSSHGLVELDPSSSKSIGRALSHIIGLLNEMPATSGKYQFAMAMVDRIVEENMRNEHVVLQEINRSALSSAFTRTANMLCRSMEGWGQMDREESGEAWPCRVIGAVPVLGSVFVSYFKGLRCCMNTILPLVTTTRRSACSSSMMMVNNNGCSGECPVAEKLAQELLWLTNKLRGCLAVDEALVQWSYASGLASAALTAHPGVQSTLVKICAILMEEMARGEVEVPRQVKYRILLLWLPFFCYASGGLSYASLTGYEKAEIERVIDAVISSLPLDDQEHILMNWMHDFCSSTSDWPNLQTSYYRWFHLCRELLV